MGSKYKSGKGNSSDWNSLAEKDLKGKPISHIETETPEGIKVKPLYSGADMEGIEFADSMPGFPPYTRGPRSTMYTGRPWTIRQYAGFSTAEASNAFYRRNLEAGQKGLSVALIWRRNSWRVIFVESQSEYDENQSKKIWIMNRIRY